MTQAQAGVGVGAPIELPGGARALFTDRSFGNLSSVGGDGREHGLRSREHLREICGVQALLRGYQVHGTVVARVYADGSLLCAKDPSAGTGTGPDGGSLLDERDVLALADGTEQPRLRADGHALAARGVGAVVLAADCVPVVLAADGAVAALHAGWRGLAAGVLEQGVRALRDVGGRGAIAAIVGPCAGACCYEVGEEVHTAFAADGQGAVDESRGFAEHSATSAGETVAAPRAGTIDLRAIARRRLLVAGVAEVGDVRACTICDERFFSHRREGERAGRQAGIAWLS